MKQITKTLISQRADAQAGLRLCCPPKTGFLASRHIFSQIFSFLACGTPDAPANGSVYFDYNTFEGEATYFCPESFTLEGRKYRTCLSTGEWSGDMPSCTFIGKLTKPFTQKLNTLKCQKQMSCADPEGVGARGKVPFPARWSRIVFLPGVRSFSSEFGERMGITLVRQVRSSEISQFLSRNSEP